MTTGPTSHLLLLEQNESTISFDGHWTISNKPAKLHDIWRKFIPLFFHSPVIFIWNCNCVNSNRYVEINSCQIDEEIKFISVVNVEKFKCVKCGNNSRIKWKLVNGKKLNFIWIRRKKTIKNIKIFRDDNCYCIYLVSCSWTTIHGWLVDWCILDTDDAAHRVDLFSFV